MADKSIDQLVAADYIFATDLLVLQQSGIAKKLPGQVLLNWLTAAADGHGGINKIEKLKTVGLVDTYRITLADTTTFDFTVNNGKGITGIVKTGTQELVDTYTISYNDGTSTTLTVTNGAKGDKGDNAYTWFKYASQEPTESSHSIGDVPDNWIGAYSGNKPSAPSDWREYKWFKWKGEKGDVGDPAVLVNRDVKYQVGDRGDVIPSGNWQAAIPVVPQGKYLWLRVTITFNSGSPLTFYIPSHQGLDGSGSVSSVAGVFPDPQGNVQLTADNVGALATAGGTMYGPLTVMQPTAPGHAARKQDIDNAVSTMKTYTDGKITWLTATLGTSWTGSGPYTQTVSVPGIPAEAKAVTCWPEWAADAATREKQREAWNAVSRIVPSAGAIAFTCDDDKPVTAVPMRIEVQL